MCVFYFSEKHRNSVYPWPIRNKTKFVFVLVIFLSTAIFYFLVSIVVVASIHAFTHSIVCLFVCLFIVSLVILHPGSGSIWENGKTINLTHKNGIKMFLFTLDESDSPVASLVSIHFHLHQAILCSTGARGSIRCVCVREMGSRCSALNLLDDCSKVDQLKEVNSDNIEKKKVRFVCGDQI